MSRYSYDIEVYPNYILVGFKLFLKNTYHFFEISEYTNDRYDLINFLRENHILISFNGIHYDNVILNAIIKHPNNTLHEVKRVNDAIIRDDYESFKYYKKKLFPSTDVDLYLYWSKMLRLSMKISLKGLMVQMQMDLIQELPYDVNRILSKEEMNNVKEYNKNDLKATEKLAILRDDEIKLRFSLRKDRGFDCYSWDQIKLASEELLKSYCDKTGFGAKTIRDLRFEKPDIYIKELLKDIDFDFKTKPFQNLLESLNNSVNTFSEKVLFSLNNTNVLLSYGVGGLHSVNKNQHFKTDNKYQLLTSDVASLYPTLIINYQLFRFKEVVKRYSELKHERILAKHGKLEGKDNDLINKFNKLVLNGVSGLLDMGYSWLYYPEGAMKLRLMGQLILTKLIEEAAIAGFNVVSANTDGIEVLVEHDRIDEYYSIVKKVQSQFNVEFEHENYKEIYYWSVNDYIAVINKNYSKLKGLMVDKPELGKSVDNLIIPKALKLYFEQDIPIKETIQNEKNIYLFCASPKVDRSYTVIWNNEPQQRLNRFFVSRNGSYLYKQKKGENLHHMLKGHTVQLLNYCTDTDTSKYDINYQYYISKCQELIDLVQPKQLSLF